MKKILTTPRSYGRDMPELFAQLEAAGYEVDGIPDRPAGNNAGNQGQGGSYDQSDKYTE